MIQPNKNKRKEGYYDGTKKISLKELEAIQKRYAAEKRRKELEFLLV